LPWALRATANYDRHGLKGLSAGQDGTGTLIGGLGGITVGMPAGPIRPYLTVGLGAFNVASEVDGASTSATKFGIDAGVGVQLKLGSIGAFVEGRLQNVFNSDTGTAGTQQTLDNLKTQIVPVTFGLHW
jgi:opacity protein-like surface antigen